jgi:tyrosyl-tRNA synthetase
MPSVMDELTWRGMRQDATEGAAEHLATGERVCYIGFDPTANSLHVGHLLQVMLLGHLQRAGHHPIALVGGGTGLIGDPSGRADERQLLSKEEAAANADAIHVQLQRFLDFDASANPARMRNNLDWLGAEKLVDFLRDVGKFFSVNAMIRRESVRRRLEDHDSGISFTEFSYQLLQAYDFLELARRDGCTVQLGGSDQWGNITAGIDLVRRVTGGEAFGVVSPLLTTAAGTKFGKTESGAVWLAADRTSPFRFYQYWVNADDRDVGTYLRFFTLLDREAIEALDEATAREPHQRAAQRALAREVTRLVHGEDGVARALKATEALFGGDLEGLGASDIAEIFADVPASELVRSALQGDGAPLAEVLDGAGVASSRGDARRAIEGGGVYVNNRRVTDARASLTPADTVEGRFIVLRKGKRSYHLVRVVG